MHKLVLCRHQSLCLLFPLTEVNLFLHLKKLHCCLLSLKITLVPTAPPAPQEGRKLDHVIVNLSCVFNDVHLQQSGIQRSEQWQPKQQWKDASHYAEFAKHVLMHFCLQQSVGDNLHIKDESEKKKTVFYLNLHLHSVLILLVFCLSVEAKH